MTVLTTFCGIKDAQKCTKTITQEHWKTYTSSFYYPLFIQIKRKSDFQERCDQQGRKSYNKYNTQQVKDKYNIPYRQVFTRQSDVYDFQSQ